MLGGRRAARERWWWWWWWVLLVVRWEVEPSKCVCAKGGAERSGARHATLFSSRRHYIDDGKLMVVRSVHVIRID